MLGQRSFDDLGTPLSDATFCVLDLETTGGNRTDDMITEIGAVKVRGGEVTIHNLRNCDYRAEFDYTCQWLTRTVALSQIEGVDLFMNYWGSPLIAHTILSFQVRGETPIAFSIETRRQQGQTYSALLGYFRQYTLICIVSDERDVVRVRTNYRHGEDLYLYHTTATPAFAQSLFLNYIGMTNQFVNLVLRAFVQDRGHRFVVGCGKRSAEGERIFGRAVARKQL